MADNELQHHGILGMKWGVRRYQNEDGSLTEAGRKRYGVEEGSSESKSGSSQSESRANTQNSASTAKPVSEMSDEELRNALNRMNMERQYNEMTRSRQNQNQNENQGEATVVDRPKTTGEMTNAELQSYINRLELEKRYSQLTAPPPRQVTKGEQFVKDVLKPAFNEVAKLYVVNTLKNIAGLNNNDSNGGNNKGSNNSDDGKKKNKNNNDSQYQSIKKELDSLKSMLSSANQAKKESKSGQDNSDTEPESKSKSKSETNSNSGSSNHRADILNAARQNVRDAQSRQRQAEAEAREQQRREERAAAQAERERRASVNAGIRRMMNQYASQARERERQQAYKESISQYLPDNVREALGV